MRKAENISVVFPLLAEGQQPQPSLNGEPFKIVTSRATSFDAPAEYYASVVYLGSDGQVRSFVDGQVGESATAAMNRLLDTTSEMVALCCDRGAIESVWAKKSRGVVPNGGCFDVDIKV